MPALRGLCLASLASWAVGPGTLTVPAQVQWTQGQPVPPISASFTYPGGGDCGGADVLFTWDGQPWAQALPTRVRPGTCTATITTQPPLNLAGAGQHEACASSSESSDCQTVTVVMTARTPTPAPGLSLPQSTPTESPAPGPTGESSPSPTPIASAAAGPPGSQRPTGGFPLGAAGITTLLVVVAIGGCALALQSVVRAGR